MSIRSPGIRARITLWYTAVLVVTVGAVLAGVYLFTRNRLEATARLELDRDFEQLAVIIANAQGDIYDIYHLGNIALFRVWYGEEQSYSTQPWNEAGLSRALELGRFDPYGPWTSPGDRRFLIRIGGVPEFGYRVAYARDVTAEKESVAGLAATLLTIFPAVVLLAVVGGYFLAGRALSPVSAVTRKAREITAERLDERLPVRNPHDEIGRLAVVFNETLARLEESFARLRRFTADASHELRIPLTSIRSVGEVALQETGGGEPACREAIASMLEETDRLTHLVDSLLLLARGDAGLGGSEKRPTDLRALVGAIVDELGVLAEEKRQELVLDAPAPVTALVDPHTVGLAITNVLHNAIRYTPEGRRIAVKVAQSSTDGRAIIDIVDSGPGVPPAERERIFDRFYRIDEARSRAEGGAGLGLAIARSMVEANGGAISFLERREPGAHCRITIPESLTGH